MIKHDFQLTSLSIAAIMAPSLLVLLQSLGHLHFQVPYVLQFLSHGDVATGFETYQHLDDVDCDNTVTIRVSLPVFAVCLSQNDPVTSEP